MSASTLPEPPENNGTWQAMVVQLAPVVPLAALVLSAIFCLIWAAIKPAGIQAAALHDRGWAFVGSGVLVVLILWLVLAWPLTRFTSAACADRRVYEKARELLSEIHSSLQVPDTLERSLKMPQR